MKYNELLKKYTEEYNNYISMGLSPEDAIVLVDKHIKDTVNVDNMTLDSILNMLDDMPSFNFAKIYNDIFKNFNEEMKKINDELTSSLEKNDISRKNVCVDRNNNSIMNNFLKRNCEDKKSLDETACCDTEVKREEPCTCECKKEVIADTPNHKEFKITFPNGIYKYKLLMK